MLKLLNLSFLPRSTDLGLLILRAGLGVSMLYIHGYDKLVNFSKKADAFNSVMGLPPQVSLGLAVFAEFFCAALVVIGFLTRFAALMLAITMGVAFMTVHSGHLTGPNAGELAFVYLVGWAALLCTGAGRISVDRA